MEQVPKTKTVFDLILDIMAVLAGIILAFILVSVCAQVVLRYFLNKPIPWIMEVSEYALLFITFLVAAWVLRKEKHVAVDIIISRLRPKVQIVTNIITSILSAMVCLLIVSYGFKVTLEFFIMHRYEATYLRIPQALILVIIPIGTLMLFIQFIRRTNGYFKELKALSNK